MITDKRYTATDLQLVCNNAPQAVLQSSWPPATEHQGLIELLKTLQDIAELVAAHEMVREQLELGPDDPIPPYSIEHGTVYDTSLAIQRSIKRMESF